VVAGYLLLSSPLVAAQPLTPHVRKSVLTLSDTELEAYREVVRSMQALPVSDPRSWRYQAGIHLYVEPEDVEAATSLTPAEKAEALPFALTPPPHAQQHDTWAQCHESDPDRVFLLWHRVYLHYFERIARAVSNQPDFALPYWDYTKGSRTNDGPLRLPAAFRPEQYVPPGGTASQTNPLFALRKPAINAGAPLEPTVVSLAALGEPTFEDFALALEFTPHNAIHGAIGKDRTGLLMGLTVWAAQDPIFWLHHANIDRLWECWKQLGTTPAPATPGSGSYTFIDEAGNVVSHTVPEMEAIAGSVDYVYAELTECPTAPPRAAIGPASANMKELTASSTKPDGGIVLGDTTTAVPAKVTPQARGIMRRPAFRTKPKDYGLRLALRDISAPAPVGLLYDVRLRPAGSAGEGISVGLLSFFGHDDRMLRPSGHRHGAETFSVQFDATSSVLSADVFPDGVPETLDVLLVPTTGVQGAAVPRRRRDPATQPVIGEIRLIVLGTDLDD